ncbi:hypothetical protein C3L33_03802, partial [Rhododendron williamsianum]
MGIEGEKRYALLLACNDSEYVKEVYGGYFNVFVAAFGEEGERWDLFRVVEGDFPDMDELQNYDGFIVSGSPYDAYANDFWILKLCFLLKTLDVMRKKVLCRAFGGKVGKAYSGWDIGLRKVRIVKDFSPCGFLDGLDQEIPPALSIIECHQDEAGMGGPGGSRSDRIFGQNWCGDVHIGDHILGIQGHPEYTKDILNNLIDRLLTNGCIEKGFAEDVKSQMEIAEPDRKCWEKICKKFLKGRWNQL